MRNPSVVDLNSHRDRTARCDLRVRCKPPVRFTCANRRGGDAPFAPGKRAWHDNPIVLLIGWLIMCAGSLALTIALITVGGQP